MQATPWNLEEATVTLREHAVQHNDLDNTLHVTQPEPTSPLAYFVNFVRKTLVITEWEIRKLRHDPTDMITRSVQPALWLLIFGEVFTRVRAIPTGNIPYIDYLAPGILAQSVLFIAIFFGITIIWERDLGVIHKFLASPTPRAALVLGKSFSAGARALPQAIVIYILSVLLGVHINWNPLALLGVIFLVVIGATCFSTFSLIIACLLKTRDRVMGIGQVMTMPLFFASNAIYPIAIMPDWLKVIAHINPLSYIVDALRALMVVGATSAFGIGTDFSVLLAITIVLITIGALLYPRIVQ
jgi:ABC-2 type transport system permease protein